MFSRPNIQVDSEVYRVYIVKKDEEYICVRCFYEP